MRALTCAFPHEGDSIEAVFRDRLDVQSGVGLQILGRTKDLTRFDTVATGWSTYAVALAHGDPDPYPHLRTYVASPRPRPVQAPVTLTAEACWPRR